MAPVHKICSFHNCKNTSDSTNLRLFPFPRSNPEKCLEWVAACENPELNAITDIFLSGNYFVCSRHFSPKDYVYKHGPLHKTSNLIPAAVPKQECVIPSTDVEVSRYKTRKKPYQQKYRKSWEKNDRFKQWLSPDPIDATKAVCTFCSSSLTADLNVLTLHQESMKHKRQECFHSKILSRDENGAVVVPVHSGELEESDDCLRNAEILLSSLVASHDLPYDIVESLDTLVKECFPDSAIAQSLHLKEYRTSEIVTDVIGASRRGYLAAKLKRTKFSMMIDSADDGDAKRICIVVTYNHYRDMLFLTELWDVIEMGPGQEASKICEAILSSFEEESVPVRQIIGVAADCFDSTMLSVVNCIRQVVPEVLIFYRMFHCLPQVVSKACLELPTACEDLVRNVHEYLNDALRTDYTLAQFPAFFQTLPASSICWISQLNIVQRMLAQWEQLQLYFSDQCFTEKANGSEIIYHALHDSFVLAFFKFLKWVLPKFILLEQDLLARKTFLPSVHEHMTATFKSLLGSYMTRDYVMKQEIINIDPRDSRHFLPLNQMYLGIAVLQDIQNEYISEFPEDLDAFLYSCQCFLVTACEQLREVYDYGSLFLGSLSVLSPKRTILGRAESEELVLIMQHLPKTANEEKLFETVEGEWKGLQCAEIPPEIAAVDQPDIFWNCIYSWKNDDGVRVFPTVSRFALHALLAPYANVDCESIFTLFQNMHAKSVSQGALTTASMSKLIAAQGLKTTGCCISLKATRKMRKMMSENLDLMDETVFN